MKYNSQLPSGKVFVRLELVGLSTNAVYETAVVRPYNSTSNLVPCFAFPYIGEGVVAGGIHPSTKRRMDTITMVRTFLICLSFL